MIPHCFNRPKLTGTWVRAGYARGKIRLRWVEHRMSQPCKAWSVPDGTIPVPWMEKWTAHCLKCMWFPKDDYRRFVNSTLGGSGS